MSAEISPYTEVHLHVLEELHFQFVRVCAKNEVSASQILNTWAVALMREWIRLDTEGDVNASEKIYPRNPA